MAEVVHEYRKCKDLLTGYSIYTLPENLCLSQVDVLPHDVSSLGNLERNCSERRKPKSD